VFDGGSLDHDPLAAKELMESLLATIRDQPWPKKKKKHPWVKVHDTVWFRIKATSTKTVSRRFKEQTESYCRNVLKQV
jgi:hypothetical protein